VLHGARRPPRAGPGAGASPRCVRPLRVPPSRRRLDKTRPPTAASRALPQRV